MNTGLTPSKMADHYDFVPFCGSKVSMIQHGGQFFTPVKPIIENLGMDWSAQFKKLKDNAADWGVTELTVSSDGGPQQMLCMPIRNICKLLLTISPNKVRPDMQEALAAYQAKYNQ